MEPSQFATDIQVPFAMSVASKRNTGKTMLMTQFIQELLKQGRIYIAFVFSNTYEMNGEWSFLPEKCKSKFDPDRLQALMDAQIAIPKDKRKEILIVLDDILGDRSVENNAIIMKFYATSRHFQCSIVLLSQIANRVLSPAVLQNSDYILYSRLNRTQLSNLFEAVTNMEKQQFIKFSEFVIKDFAFVIVDNTVQSNKPEDFLKIVRALPEKKSSKP
jgi:hypothetical protein